MAKLSKASFTPRSRPPRRDMYEVPTTVESDDDEDESGKPALSPHHSNANPNASPRPAPSSLLPPNITITPDRPAPTDNPTSSRKSVQFKDPIATESAGLLSLAVARKAKGRSKGKLVRPSSLTASRGPKSVRQTRRSDKVQVDTGKALPNTTALYPGDRDAQTSSPGNNGNGGRRSGRMRQDVATYNDTYTTRAAAGLTSLGQRKKRSELCSTASPAKDHSHRAEHSGWKESRQAGQSRLRDFEPLQSSPAKSKRAVTVWTKQEEALLKRLHREGLTIQEMKKHFTGRSENAIIGRHSLLKLGPVNRAPENLDNNNERKRKAAATEQTTIGPVKCHRVEGLPASRSPLSQTSPAQIIKGYNSRPPGFPSPSIPMRVERPLKQNDAPQSKLQRDVQVLVDAESPRKASCSVQLVQRRSTDVREAMSEQAGNKSDSPEALVHAIVQEDFGEDEGSSQASEPEDDAYRPDRNDSAPDINDEGPDAPLMPRLFHQFARLQKVVESGAKLQAHVSELNIHRPAEPLFEGLDRLRRKIQMSYQALLDPATEQDAIEEKNAISRRIARLQRLVKDLDADVANVREPQLLSTNIFAFVIPDILTTLASASENVLERTESDDDIVASDISQLIGITRCLTTLGTRALNGEAKVNSDLALVRPVKNNIVAPLNKVLREFERNRDRLEAENEETEKRLRRLQEVRRMRAEREMEKKRLAKLTTEGDRLRVLYMWRMEVEPDLDRLLGKLAMPSLRQRDKIYPLDANGDPFEREAVFKPRSSIPHMDRASAADEDDEWTEEELEALQEGLAEIAHNEIFWKKFFKRYCHYRRNDDGSRGGPLRDRNVAEILKEMCMSQEDTLAVDYHRQLVDDNSWSTSTLRVYLLELAVL
ncbi:hypothetical protein FKW77_007326 [Venturia effusa]|uniref:Uncharacterized protein n=1 Tax=Venturia effusa TaxID=50376 RepID=A0A517L9I5_9PEZI|nr:hypothetical protein FKW77_007326 [Venturia effusa]